MAGDRDRELADLVEGFERCTLPKPRWTHAAHLEVALHYVRTRPFDEATRAVRDGIRRYNASVGTPEHLFHETVTLAWLHVVRAFVASRPKDATFAELADDLVRTCGVRGYLERFYSPDLLQSEPARLAFVAPDRAPLPVQIA